MIRGLRRTIALAGAMFIACMQAGPATAAEDTDFPTRPLRLVVPYPPGASTDLISRAIAEEAGKRLGQPIIVENRPGGGTVVGTQAVRNSPADGYTLMFQAASLLSNTYMLKKPGYQLSDFTAVTMLSDAAYVMLIPAKLPAKNLAEFIAYAKANPGKLNYGTLGRGTRTFVLPYRLGKAAGLDWTEITFKGTTEAAQAVMSGDIQTYFSTQAYASTQLESDRLRLIAISSEKRVDFLPNIPTFKESGYPDVTDQTWYALFTRSEVPAPILKKLKAALADAMKSPAMKEQLKINGLSPYDGTLEDFPAKMNAERAKFIAEAKQLGIEPQ
jgi:tripartite-type tricarboxylate transporter receptor subunit TctC